MSSTTIPGNWKINLQDYVSVDGFLDEMISQGVSYHNYSPEQFPAHGALIDLVATIRKLLADPSAGAALVDLKRVLDPGTAIADKIRLLIVMIGNSFGRTITRNHLTDSPFFPMFHRKEGKGRNYRGNALSNNQPGVHTDGSGWRDAHVDLLVLLSFRRSFFGGTTIMVNALDVFDALPSDLQHFLLTRDFVRQDPFDPDHINPVKRSIYHEVRTSFYAGRGIKYHRSFIEDGHRFLNEPLSKEDLTMLNSLETFFDDPSFRHHIRLQSGQILLVNNNIICHDRTEFRDLWKWNRYLERYWAGEFYAT